MNQALHSHQFINLDILLEMLQQNIYKEPSLIVQKSAN